MTTRVNQKRIRSSDQAYDNLYQQLRATGGSSGVPVELVERVAAAESSITALADQVDDTEASLVVLSDRVGDTEDAIISLQDEVANLPVGGSGGGSYAVQQVTKLGVYATAEIPHIVGIAIPTTMTFARPPLDVLKFIPGEVDVVQTICAFNNADASSFVDNPHVSFDGEMSLKTSYVEAMTLEGTVGGWTVWSHTVEKSSFRKIEKIEVI